MDEIINQFIQLQTQMEHPTVFLIVYNVPKEFDQVMFQELFPVKVEITEIDYQCLHHHFVIVGFNTIDDCICCYNEIHNKIFYNRKL